MNDRTDRIKGRCAYGGVLFVPCQINGLYRYWFLADTGAAQTVIRPQVAHEIGTDAAQPLRRQQISSVHQTAWVPVVRLEQVQVGHRVLSGIEALILELPRALRIDGILGVNFLNRFRVTFEFDRATLILRTRPDRP